MANLQAGSERDGLILRSHWQPGGEPWLEIIHAEPRALFSGVLLRKVRRGEASPFTEMSGGLVGIGSIVTIRARDRNVVYRLIEYDERRDVYTGEWPD
jgi:hypothetical protein